MVAAERVGPLYEQGNGDTLITTTAENETAFINKETLALRREGDRVRGLWIANRCMAKSVQAYILRYGDNA